MLRIRLQVAADDVPAGDYVLVLWDALTPPPGYTGTWVSLPAEVRRNRSTMRARYLEWLRDTGEGPDPGTALAARLLIRADLSYWWLTAPAEFSFEEDSLAYAVLRVMAFADWARDRSPAVLECAVDDRALRQCLRTWCEGQGWQFAPTPPEEGRTRSGGRGILSAGRRWLQAWRDARAGSPSSTPPGGATGLVVDYLAHVQVDATGARSRYWAGLPGIIRSGGATLDWLHIFVPAPLTPTAREARDIAERLNVGQEWHVVAQADFGWACRLGAWIDYLRLRLLRWRFLRQCPRLPLGDVDPWHLLRARTADAFIGAEAMENCLWIRYFDRVLARRSRYLFGLYLQENQPWEMALVSAWRRHGHGTLVGVEHTTVRFWDLRLLKLPPRRELRIAAMPRPHLTVLNGPAAETAVAGMADLADRSTTAEALRFLGEFGAPSADRAGIHGTGPLRLLAVGEYDPGYAADQRRLLRDLEAAASHAGTDVAITWRPHPAAVGTATDLPQGASLDQASPLPDLLAACDLALVGDFSSSVLLAESLGVPVAVLLPARTLSSDLLADPAGTVTTAAELLDLLVASAPRRERGLSMTGRGGIDRVFHLDPGLVRWRATLGEAGVPSG
ncbi:MAG: hypothetical protein Q7V58_05150 [Actinomycetota bacterium]|nr:hypothetical protein [Actinomycetota bacterium]